MRNRTSVACLALLILATGPGGRGQSPEETAEFRVETRLIEVDVHVTDRSGRFVGDLEREDFEILENGVAREVSFITTIDLPIDRRGRPVTIEPDTIEPDTGDLAPSTAETGSALNDIGRLYLLILDSGIADQVQRIAHLFIDEFLGPHDLMAVLHVGRPALGQGLTSDKALLRAAVMRYSGGGAAGIASFRALKDAAVHLNAVSGRRKGILFVSTGTGATLWTASADQGASARLRGLWRELDDALRTAAQNNVRVYPIEPSGFRTFVGGNLAGESSDFIEDPQLRLGVYGFFSRAGDAAASLRMMAAETGGRAIVNTNNYAGNFRRIVEEHSAYYMLGYYSQVPRDGAFHRIEVRVRHPGVSVRARRGVRAPLADVPGPAVALPRSLSAGARTALQEGGPPGGHLEMELAAAVFRRDTFTGSIRVESRVAGPALSLNAGDTVELAYAAVDSWGRIRAVDRQAFTMHLQPGTRARVEEAGLVTVGRLDVPAGRYEIRVTAQQPGGAAGLVTERIEVPHFAELSLSISDLVFVSSEGDRAVRLMDDDRLRMVAGTPTARRRFDRSETLTIAGEIYDSHWLLAADLVVTSIVTRSALRDNAAHVVLRDVQRLTALDGGVFSYRSTIPLMAFEPGAYVLTVEAHTGAGVPAATSRQVDFEVW